MKVGSEFKATFRRRERPISPFPSTRAPSDCPQNAPSSRLTKAKQARAKFEESGKVEYVKAASNTDKSAAMYMEGDALDYYLNPKRGAIPQWGGRFATMAWTEWLKLDPIASAAEVKVPTRVITGPKTATPTGATAFAEKLSVPHDVVTFEGTQFDFYDDPKLVAAAVAAAVEHFKKTL
jgi:uncharacterized protein